VNGRAAGQKPIALWCRVWDDRDVRPAAGELLHFSEDPTITCFAPHVAATAQVADPLVWAVDAGIAPAYWFPRDCPRVLAWATPETITADRERILGPGGGDRVHAIEYAWLDTMRNAQLFAYRLPADRFRPLGTPVPHAWVSSETIEPLGPAEFVGDLVGLHHDAGIQLRVLPSLAEFWAAVKSATVGFSGIRLRNAGRSPRPPLAVRSVADSSQVGAPAGRDQDP
jgi:hypothetical protein